MLDRLRPSSLRPLVVLVATAVVAVACVNQGFDEDPVAASESDGDPVEQAAADPSEDDRSDQETDPGSDEPDGGSPAAPSGDLPVGAVADAAALASIESVACDFDQAALLPRSPSCYEVSVPEDWADPDPDDQVVLPVAVFPADEGSVADDATIYLDGGPGVATLDLLWSSFSLLHQPQVGPRDYITYDQRGVGRAEPALTCPELGELEVERLAGEIDPAQEADVTIAAVAACRDRLEAEGADLDAYNSVASANDVEAIRALLGYERLNLVGVSYGTRLAQTYLRQYPQVIRSVVLDSIVPVEADLWTNLAPEAQGAFEQLFAGCAADPACAETHPDLENRFFALADQLDADPIEVEFRDLIGGDTVPAVVDGDELIGLVFQALYDRGSFSLVPSMVAEIEQGDYGTVEFFGSIGVTNLPYAALGMRLSVECNEEIAFESEADLVANAPTDPGYRRLGELDGEATLFDLCEAWPAGAAPDVEAEPVISDVPTLLLAGAYDPITRPGNADVVAASLTNEVSFLLPDEGHGLVSTPCGAELVAAFLDDPSETPDDACIASSPTPVWVPGGDDEEIELVAFEVTEPLRISGLRPEGWLDAGGGIFARQQTAADPTSLIVQPTGGVVPAFVVELLEGQLGVEFEPGAPLDAGGREWETFDADDDPDQVVRLAASSGRDGVLVVLVATADDVDRLYDEVFVPAVGAAVAG